MRFSINFLAALAVTAAPAQAEHIIYGNHFEAQIGATCQTGQGNTCTAAVYQPPANVVVQITNITCQFSLGANLRELVISSPNGNRRLYPEVPPPIQPNSNYQFNMETSFLAGRQFGWPTVTIQSVEPDTDGATIFCHYAGKIAR